MSVGMSGVVTVLVSLAVGLIIGGLIGHFGTKRLTPEEEDHIKTMQRLTGGGGWRGDDDLNKRIIELVDRRNLRNDLIEISKKPHVAASTRNAELAEMMQIRFLEAGFDTAALVPYMVLLSLPDPENPNLITWIDGDGEVVFNSTYEEVALHKDDADPEFLHAFNAYSPAADVKTEAGTGVVYANYGREEDFEKLAQLGVNVSGALVIARYGKIFRGNKVLHAQQRGAIGVILFSDPLDVAPNGTAPGDVYPNSWWLPGSGMQRGSIFMGEADPLTPGWPSTATAHRVSEEDAELPKIPCQPIGYDDARVILEKMGGTAPPEEWKGGLEGVPYNLGPQLLDEYENYTLRLDTHNRNTVRRAYNVIGTIKGSVEPDRYVLVGNHRDAWGYGAADPSSGTTQLLETARVFGVLLAEGWRPRRTLVFCSWSAEEFGLIGASEWVEEHVSKLQERAVMYLNTDTCTKGPILNAAGSPLLWDAVTQVTKLMPGVKDGKTLYDEWANYHAHWNRTTPKVGLTGSGSDHAHFAFYAGIPSLNIDFNFDKRIHNISTYPFYHTGYETFYMVDTFIDPEFAITQGCSRLAALTLRYFADVHLLPYSLPQFPKAMKEALDAVKKDHHQRLLTIYPKFTYLEEALDNLTIRAEEFDAQLKETASDLDPVSLRAVNDQMREVEQLFLLPSGLPNRPMTRHAIFAPSQFDNYAAAGFPGIIDLLYGIDKLQGDELAAREETIRRHVSQLTILMQTATSFLSDLYLI